MTDPDGQGPGDAQPKDESENPPEIDIDSAFAAIVAEFANPTPPGGGPWPASEDLDDPDAPSGPDGPPGDGPATGRSTRPTVDPPEADPPGERAPGHDGPAGPAGPSGSTGPTRPGDPHGPADPTRPADPTAGSTTPMAPTERRDPVRRRIVLPGDDTRPFEAGAPGGPRDWQPADEEDEGFVPPEPPPLPRGDLVSRIAWGAVIGGPLFLLVAALSWRTLPSTLLLIALLAFVGGFVTLVARMPQDHPDDPDDGAVV